MYYNKKQSLFELLIENIRNGLAHGTFNYHDGSFFLITQHRPKPDSHIKMYLKTDENINDSLSVLFNKFNDMIKNPITEKYACLTDILDLSVVNEQYFSRLLNRYILIDDAFTFQSASHVKEIQDTLSSINDNTIIIINESLSKFALKNLQNQSKNTEMITIDSLLERVSAYNSN